MFPGDGELRPLLVGPLDSWIFVAVDVFSQPRDEQRFTVRHFCRRGRGNSFDVPVLVSRQWKYCNILRI